MTPPEVLESLGEYILGPTAGSASRPRTRRQVQERRSVGFPAGARGHEEDRKPSHDAGEAMDQLSHNITSSSFPSIRPRPWESEADDPRNERLARYLDARPTAGSTQPVRPRRRPSGGPRTADATVCMGSA